MTPPILFRRKTVLSKIMIGFSLVANYDNPANPKINLTKVGFMQFEAATGAR